MEDFYVAEFQSRLSRAQDRMATDGYDALFLTTEAELRYFTGFRTLFWQSPTRPWFLILPQSGAPIAVVPSIGAELMGKTWVQDIRIWPSPRGEDEGVSLLIEALTPFGRIGLPMGEESSLRMGLTDFHHLKAAIPGVFADCTGLIKALRMVKSPSEIALIRRICDVASRGFAHVPDFVSVGEGLDQVFRRFKIALLEEGAEDVPYLVGARNEGDTGMSFPRPTRRLWRRGMC